MEEMLTKGCESCIFRLMSRSVRAGMRRMLGGLLLLVLVTLPALTFSRVCVTLRDAEGSHSCCHRKASPSKAPSLVVGKAVVGPVCECPSLRPVVQSTPETSAILALALAQVLRFEVSSERFDVSPRVSLAGPRGPPLWILYQSILT